MKKYVYNYLPTLATDIGLLERKYYAHIGEQQQQKVIPF